MQGQIPTERTEEVRVSLCTSTPPCPTMKMGHLSGRSDPKVSKAAVSGWARQLGAVSFPVGAIESAVGFQPPQKLLLLLGDLDGSRGPVQSRTRWDRDQQPPEPRLPRAGEHIWAVVVCCVSSLLGELETPVSKL